MKSDFQIKAFNIDNSDESDEKLLQEIYNDFFNYSL